MAVKEKPGFFTSTKSGRGITGTVMQRYNFFLIYANLFARKCKISSLFNYNCKFAERNA